MPHWKGLGITDHGANPAEKWGIVLDRINIGQSTQQHRLSVRRLVKRRQGFFQISRALSGVGMGVSLGRKRYLALE